MNMKDFGATSAEFAQTFEDFKKQDVTKDDLITHMFEEFKNQEENKDDLILKLIDHIKKHEQSSGDLVNELKFQKEMTQYQYKEINEKDKEIESYKSRTGNLKLALVLIDGDMMLFHDEFIKNGHEGGIEAARQLKTATNKYLKDVCSSYTLIVRVYANFSGLSKVFPTSNIGLFVQGFNMFDGNYEMVDAGSGKECADEKVRKMFEIFISDVRCVHLIFGGSGDNGYARMLGSYIGQNNITLLEGPPFANELLRIAGGLQTTRFDSVFRSSKCVVPSGPPISPLKESSSHEIAIAQNSYAKTASKSVGISTPVDVLAGQSLATHEVRSVPKAREKDFEILRNAHGERIDSVIDVWALEIQEAKQHKYCNCYHLLGSCEYPRCGHTHGPRLTGRAYLIQRAVARKSPCKKGLSCDDKWCTSGHQCSSGSLCIPSKCWFPKEMHNVDTKVVKTITI